MDHKERFAELRKIAERIPEKSAEPLVDKGLVLDDPGDAIEEILRQARDEGKFDAPQFATLDVGHWTSSQFRGYDRHAPDGSAGLAAVIAWLERRGHRIGNKPTLRQQVLALADALASEYAKASEGAGGTAPKPDGSPFYKPEYFARRWKIGDDLLRTNAADGHQYKKGKVRRRRVNPKTAKRAAYWYSEPDAQKRWPHLFAPTES